MSISDRRSDAMLMHQILHLQAHGSRLVISPTMPLAMIDRPISQVEWLVATSGLLAAPG
jgi:hypothetical protein